MYKNIFYLSILLFFTVACNKTCGEDVNLGTYNLTNQTKEEWFPEMNSTKLVFINSSGDTLYLKGDYSTEMRKYQIGAICENSDDDFAVQYFKGEIIMHLFKGSLKDVDYIISLEYLVNYLYSPTHGDELILYDNLRMGCDVSWGDGSYENRNGCDISIITDSRGTDMTLFPYYPSPDFSNTITLNEQTFKNVMYSSNDKNVPSLFFKKDIGIIAFVGKDNEVWVLQ